MSDTVQPSRRGTFGSLKRRSQHHDQRRPDTRSFETPTPETSPHEVFSSETPISTPDPSDTSSGSAMDDHPNSPSLSVPSDSVSAPESQEQSIPTRPSGSRVDPPSGGTLLAEYLGVSTVEVTVPDPAWEKRKMLPVKKGRGITCAWPSQNDANLRKPVTVSHTGVIQPKIARNTISNLLRMHFEGSYYTWDMVTGTHRQLMWDKFGMACRWPSHDNNLIMARFIHLCKLRYTDMVQRAHVDWMDGYLYKGFQLRELYKIESYWKSNEFEKLSLRNQKNRGVLIDSRTKEVVKKAKPTYTGGSKSLEEHGGSREAYVRTKQRTHKKPKKNISGRGSGVNEESLVDGGATASGVDEMVEEDEAMAKADQETQVPVFIDSDVEVFISSYDKNMDEKYKDKPQDRPSDTDRIDAQCWAMAGGVPNRGRVRGVSRNVIPQTVGFTTVSQMNRDNGAALCQEAMAVPLEELRKELKECQKQDNEKDAKISQLEAQNKYIMNYLSQLFPQGFGMPQNGSHFGIPAMNFPHMPISTTPLQTPLSSTPQQMHFTSPQNFASTQSHLLMQQELLRSDSFL